MGVRGAVFELLEAVFEKVKRPDTVIDIRPPERGARASLWPHQYFKFYAYREIFETIQKAEPEGYDGVLIGQSAEPVLSESKEVLNIPVTGISESGFHLANQLGESFAFVSIPTPPGVAPTKQVLPILENIKKYGLESRFKGWKSIDMSSAELYAALAQGNREVVHKAFMDAAESLVDAGAEVILPAETLLSVALAADGIIEGPGGSAIVDIVGAGVKNLEMLVDLHKSTGLLRSRSLTYARPLPIDIADTRAAYGLEPI